MRKILSKIPFNYKTIKVTQSRIDKGLLAIPVSLLDYFPKNKTKIYITFGGEDVAKPKNFTPYTSSSRECRIGGMKEYYEILHVSDGDELVVQIMDDNKYRILTEKQFENLILRTEKKLDNSKNENEAIVILTKLSNISKSAFDETVLSEYYRLSKQETKRRKYSIIKARKMKESVPPSIRKILEKVYMGRCQISGFTFLTKGGNPYFEMHHVKTDLGHHIKNILVVSPNIHAQFTYACIEEFFDKDGWLRHVKFNGKEFEVKHAIDKIPKEFVKEIHSEQ